MRRFPAKLVPFHLESQMVYAYSLDTRRKFSIHKTFRRRLWYYLNVLTKLIMPSREYLAEQLISKCWCFPATILPTCQFRFYSTIFYCFFFFLLPRNVSAKDVAEVVLEMEELLSVTEQGASWKFYTCTYYNSIFF